MHILELPEPVQLSPDDIIPVGVHVLDDVNAAHLLVLAAGGIMRPLEQIRDLASVLKTGEQPKILLQRAGGFGDLILLTPVLRELKRQFPDCKIAISTMRLYSQVLVGLPYIDEILPYPVSYEKALEYNVWTWFENAIERNPAAKKIHMTDLFGKIIGVHMGAADMKPDYRVKPSEMIWAREAFPRKGRRRCGIQVGTSALCRTYPRKQLGLVVGQLMKREFEVFLLGAKGEIEVEERPFFRNLSASDLTFRQSCAVINDCDVVLGSDSALIHVAGALGVPAVGLYGPFPSKLRIAYSPSVHGLDGEGDCAPCFHHVNAAKRNRFPANCPSKSKGECQVLGSLAPDRIASKVASIAMERAIPSSDEVIPFTSAQS